MSEKKRKRRDKDGDRPSKRNAISPPPGNIKVEFVENKDVVAPVLASASGFDHIANVNFKPYISQAKDKRSELLLHSSEHNTLDYVAREEKDGSSGSHLKDYIGVYDPATGTLKLMEARKLTVRSTLRSEIEDMQAERAREEARTQAAQAPMGMTAKRHALAAEFGSRKSKKAITGMAENAIARGRAGDPNAPPMNEAVADAVLDNMANATANMPTKEDQAAAVSSSKPRPRVNTEARYAAEVYTIDAVVGTELMSLIHVKDWIEATEQGTGVQKLTSAFVAKRITRLAKNKEIQKLKMLKFVYMCMNFNASLQGRGSKAKRIPPRDQFVERLGPDTPPPVADAILRKFASENKDMTRWHIDNLITHAAAVTLIIDDYEVDVNDLREDFRLDNKEIKQYFSELGCRLAKPTEAERTKFKITKAEADNHVLAKLRLPLSFPKVGVGKKRK
ncbi:DNA-directed RNA polymeras-like protein I 49 kDa polypeptide [Polyplosphaeria fusca]|uniref:DNA-directed RNA polymeras-like protein I 49 kDa polypeptide n=1 Tax=Polyplosphaeria fusca TaxID=682080 RepID=A0A9P4R898_9PLEO|nr:DNA-directed RNA polymeras-like protein I 49 kDa polypeptide [Polyplosphaeria fusca]